MENLGLLAGLERAARQRGHFDPDGLLVALAKGLGSLPTPSSPQELERILRRHKTAFFRANETSPQEVAYYLWPVLAHRVVGAPAPGKPNVGAVFVAVDDIDSFCRVRDVPPGKVRALVPLQLQEDDIQRAVEEIIGEPGHPRDWGGETSDLFTTRVVLKGRRRPSAWLLKGRGLRGKLTPARAGKTGTQVARLFQEPADVFVVQHVDEVDSSINEEMQLRSDALAQDRGEEIYYCVLDGTDTARLLRAYRKL